VNESLPILPYREKIVGELKRAGVVVLGAPTGSGKSTQVPQFLMGRVPGKILVLEPRRLSARSLASRVAAETKTALGTRIGYQVRFDNRTSKETAVVFQTYGVFVQQLLRDLSLTGIGGILLDEFHERTLECDLALAWLLELRKTRPDLKVVVMSATLDAAAVVQGAARVDAPGKIFPVETTYQPLGARVEPAQGALDALRELSRRGLDGSVLVFMPGVREIRRTLTLLGPYCRQAGLDLQSLHGSMELDEQQRAMEPGDRPRVIVATNVAETGLTIPGVTAVIDSGLHRVAAYDAARGINTLYLSRISRGNAAQRAGRAGRTAPGRCVRLWSKADEAGMAESLKPEMLRLELSSLYLQAASLPRPARFLTPPPPIVWQAARNTLEALGALDAEGRITERGRALLRYPVSPRLAAVLLDAASLAETAYERTCRMAAVFETSQDRRPGSESDLSALTEESSWETEEVFRQLNRLKPDVPPKEGTLAGVWLSSFVDRLGARSGDGGFYALQDGRGVLLSNVKAPPPLILALDVRERAGGGQSRQVTAGLYLPLAVEDVTRAFPGECRWSRVSEFDERQKRVVEQERLMFRGLALERREITAKTNKAASAEIWAEKLASGEVRHPGLDEKVEQLVTRIKIARRLFPDMGFPEMSRDDWRLVYEEVCAGRNNLRDIGAVSLIPKVEEYLGPALTSFLNRMLPLSKKLPSGKLGKLLYNETRPPELSARLGDFVKMTGTLSLCEGRLPVLFDILAPNYRTVQKTHDLASFWANTYPEVKKELKRRYPRHPWP
jgi:ATP-dependent helicase HrpB